MHRADKAELRAWARGALQEPIPADESILKAPVMG